MHVFVVHYAERLALPVVYADQDALMRGFNPEFHDTIADAAKIALANPGDPVDIEDGDVLIYQEVIE